eukprot:c8373_g1_i1.p1 GENE.c8373_g1_i1~~c8373_g1_i1.p1  ORF type:complete len:673 (+),score=169.57 c8373_g1_i1:1-2019(+)
MDFFISFHNTMGEEVSLAFPAYQELVRELELINKPLPKPFYVIPRVHVSGVVDTTCCVVTFTFQVEVLSGSWNFIPMLNASAVLVEWRAKQVTVFQNDDLEITHPVLQSVLFGIQNGKHVCVVQQPGKYVVICKTKMPFANDRKHALTIDIPECSVGDFIFRLKHTKASQITCPQLISHALAHDADGTTLTGTFAPTTSLSVMWTQVLEVVAEMAPPKTEKVEPVKQEEMITCEQNTSYSVGEGVLQVTSNITYLLVNASRSTFELSIHPELRVLQVDAEYLSKWTVSETALPNQSGGPSHVTLKVVLSRAVIDSFLLTLSLEMDMNGTSVQNFSLPVLHCFGVAREKGNFVIEARTNVEVNESQVSGVAPIDVSELPPALLSASPNPLLAYKSLNPKQSLISINVTKHKDTEVLISAIDSALFEVTVSSEGKALHRLLMKVRNTQQQYMRATLPANHTIWSTVIAGKAIKPAMDDQGRLMVPLNKSSRDQAQNSFTVEMVFLVEIPRMSLRGSLDLDFAKIDIPSNVLMIAIHLPKQYKYSRFTGSIEETKHFSTVPPASETAPQISPIVPLYAAPIRRDSRRRAFDSEDEDESESMQLDDMVTNSFKMKESAPIIYAAKSLQSRVGVVPVQVDFPVTGKEFRFEKLLVTDEAQHIHVNYKKSENASCCPW